ncbi:hypothetical protein [Ensifer aridi]|uniref:hypothetical protein n=1 Tax=Ensifer aridi TaxID=1708715 RepID=UPI000A10335F|nr:hypothetical protein [Ensifer aridi]
MATVRFTATGTDKHLKVTDKLNSAAKPEFGFQKVHAEKPFEVAFSTYDGATGKVKIEVSRNGSDYGIHEPGMIVRHDEQPYTIDDSKLPAHVEFKATESDKYIKVTDNLDVSRKPKVKFQKVSDPPFKVAVSAENGNGNVKVEVSKDDTDYELHDDDMQVTHGGEYPINDASLRK